MLPLARRSIIVFAAALCVTLPTSIAAAQSSAQAPLSRAELLAYLRSIPSYQDFSVPYEVRKAAHDKLTALVTQRGVDFRYDMSRFDKELSEAGISPQTQAAIAGHYRQAAAPAAAAAPATSGSPSSPAPAPPSAPRAPAAPAAPAAGPGTAAAQGPLSRADVLAHLKSIPKSQDASVPYQVRKDAHDALTRLIKARGVGFQVPAGTFDKEFYEAGIGSETSIAIWQNYRAPGAPPPSGALAASPSFFTGRWAMGAAGMNTQYDRQGSAIVRTDQMTGARGGFLEIAADGTYAWQHNSADPVMRGRWRTATPQELGTDPGTAVVLLGGYDGADWIVTRRPSDVPGEHVTVSRLGQRYLYFIGSR
jgi:uncharacterized protein (UPF0147 family)